MHRPCRCMSSMACLHVLPPCTLPVLTAAHAPTVACSSLSLRGNNLLGADHLKVHGLGHGDEDLLALVEVDLQLSSELVGVVGAGGQGQVVTGVAIFQHQGHEALIVDVNQGVLSPEHVGDIAVVGGRGQVLVLLAREDVNADEVALGVAVLAGLGGGHIRDLARLAVDDNVSVLADGAGLLRVGQRGTRGRSLEGLVLVI
mmetsp:Transcript_26600/g.79044  ORF Transcript_26600/g.79044 Transcript_26600/m.79044 type:complete len:201 (+) Transcript_26600:2468-3070(+)